MFVLYPLSRHRDVTKESALRHAAEDRLEQLVDMYGDPAVNEELRSRLPHASQGPDVRKAWQQELDDLIQSELEEEQSKRPLRRYGDIYSRKKTVYM